MAETPYPKRMRHLPSILSPEEVAHLIDSARTGFHRMVLMTLCGTGAQRAELAHFEIPDIDSRRMVIPIRGGKGRQDRDVMLSPTLLQALRDYWRGLNLVYTTTADTQLAKASAAKWLRSNAVMGSDTPKPQLLS